MALLLLYPLLYPSLSVDASIPLILAFIVALQRLNGQITQINSTIIGLSSSSGQREKYYQLFRLPAISLPTPQPINIKTIELRSFSFKYPSEPYLFSETNIFLDLTQPVSYFLSAPSGSGKSTLFDILVGFLPIHSGSFLINDLQCSTVYETVMDSIVLVDQQPLFIDGTIRDNLLLGRSELTDGEIMQALDIACMTEVISSLPAHLSTLITSKASLLSSGQRQRLSIARAVLRRPQLLLLDEATANIDHTTECKIINNLKQYTTASIVISSHNTDLRKFCDSQLIIANSKINSSPLV